MYKIQSEHRTALVNPQGAELHSLIANSTGEEFMWSGDPAVWSGRAPILFPIVGGLKNDQFSVNGKWYSMEKHGFARFAEFNVMEHNGERISLQLTSNPALLEVYPWRFELLVEFVFENDDLVIRYSVHNRDSRKMAFNIGSHPAFRLPMHNAVIEDYQIRFNAIETLDSYGVVDGLLARQSRPYLHDESLIPLKTDIFDQDALVFRNLKSTEISLEHRTEGPRVSVSTDHAPHLGLWAKPAAPYVCIEPWWGHADFEDASGDIFSKASIQTLEAGENFSTGITIATIDVS